MVVVYSELVLDIVEGTLEEEVGLMGYEKVLT